MGSQPLFPHQRRIWRAAPFAAAALLIAILALAFPPQRFNGPTLAAVFLAFAVAAVSLLRAPPRFRDLELLLPVTFLVAVALLRQGGGGVGSGYNTLVLVAVMWTAVHGDRTQLGIVLAGVVAVFVLPLLLDRPGVRADGDSRLAVVLPALCIGIGLTVQRLLQAFGAQTLAAERRSAVLRARQSVTRMLAEAASLESAIPKVLTTIGENLGWPFAVFWRVHHRQDVLRPATVWQEPGFEASALRTATARCTLPPGECLPGRVWETGSAAWLYGSDVEDSAGRAAAGRAAGLSGSVAFPVRQRGEVIGVIECFVYDLDVPEEELREMLDDLALLLEQLVDRVEHSAQLTELEVMARTEELTGLPNRRAWDETLPRELARARRNGLPLCVALLDVDHFKEYNDEHGHQAGDELLRDTATRWRAALRTSDFLARFGGDEFIALLPDCTVEQGVGLVERLRTASPRPASVGLAQWTGTETGDDLVRRADAALYSAKTRGRDRLEIASTA
ncbi:MAG: diguanylate cyclase [Solirubrobacteraceae bacterium]